MAIICNYHQVVAVKEILAVKEVSVVACISLLQEQKLVLLSD